MQSNHEGKWCWGPFDGEEYSGDFEHEWEAHAAARDYVADGDNFKYEVAQKTHPLNLVEDSRIGRKIELLLEGIDELAHDEVGGDEIVMELSGQDDYVLIDFLRTFILERAKVRRWGVKNVRAHTIIAGQHQEVVPMQVERDKNGYWWHPAVPEFGEGDAEKSRAWIKDNNLETEFSDLEWEHPDTPASVAYFDNADTNITAWNPAPPAGDGWFTLGIGETDDGPRWWWARRKEGGAA